MNAEALIGTVLGTCTLQKLIGQGGMGAVYLAQQSRPRRQVAVKVLLPMTPLTPNQLSAFLERFRRETDAAASLEHPNIMPVHEYGERDGLAYLVMPYIGGGTLRDEMERDGALSLDKAANYLDQMAAALDFAHTHGVIHRDIKPANILITPEGRLLLADFGLVKIISEGPQGALMRLTGPGAPVGTPDYMAPEQVVGAEIDSRADLYSLGVMLYQMVTGQTPFQGDSPMQIATQHLQLPPPSPRVERPDLPVASEQVILRSLAKRPSERYAYAQDLATAFRQSRVGGALSGQTGAMPGIMNGATGARLYSARGLLDPSWQTSAQPALDGRLGIPPAQSSPTQPAPTGGTGLLSRTGMFPTYGGTGRLPALPDAAQPPVNEGTGFYAAMPNMAPPAPTGGTGLLSRTGMFPAMTNNNAAPAGGAGLLSRTGMMAALPPASVASQSAQLLAGEEAGLLYQTGAQPSLASSSMPVVQGLQPANGLPPQTGTFAPMGTGMFPAIGAMSITPPDNLQASPANLEQPSPVLENSPTGSWMVSGQQLSPANTVKLTGPVKVIQVPVAGQPGRYMTGLLPVVSTQPESEENAAETKKPRRWMMVISLVTLLVILLGSAGGLFWFLHSRSARPQAAPPQVTSAVSNPAKATLNADSNIILFDPLKANIHNWKVDPTRIFKDGAYHVINDGDGAGTAILQGSSLNVPLTYALTMQEIAGDDTSANNSFGLVFRFSQQQQGSKKVTTFYSFEVLNMKGGEYQLWKYDDSQGANASPWTEIWHAPFGSEFHLGKGQQSTNTFKVSMNGGTFTLIVNDKTVNQNVKDSSFAAGTVGMLVNLKGTEVAFSNMLLTKN